MKTWLKLIGSAEKPITDNWKEPFIGFRKASTPRILKGERVFLYASGHRCIFALAEAVGDPEPDPKYNPNEDGSCRWILKVDYSIWVPVPSGIPVKEITSQRDWRKSLSQKSHVLLRANESQLAETLLRDAFRKLQEKQGA
jgi:hypothetical protein